MYYKIIIASIMILGLHGCAKNMQDQDSGSGTCRQVKQEMSQSYPPQIQRPTAINRAKLLRDYEHYDCDQQ